MELVNFLLFLVDVFLDFDPSLLIFRGIVENFLFFLVVFLELFILGSEVLIDVDQIVDFLVEHIDISEQVVVLLLSFDESVLDLENVGQSCCFFDGGKGLVDNLHVSLVVIDKFHFLLIVDDEFGQSMLQNSSSVILDGIDLSSFDPASSVEFGIFQFFVQFCKSAIVVGLVFLVFHLEAEHHVLTHFAGVLTGFDVLHQAVDFIVCLLYVVFEGFEVVLIHGLLLSEQVDGVLQFRDLSHGLVVPFVVLS